MSEDLVNAISRIVHQPHERQMLLRTVVHELRSPLLTIRMGCDLLEKNLKLDPENQEVLTYIRQATGHLEIMMANLTELGRLVANIFSVSCHQHKVDPLIQDAVISLTAESTVRNVAIRKLGGEGLTIWCDSGKLRQILLNVLCNALMASPAGQTIDIHVREDVAADRVVIDIVDRGPGIAIQQQEMVFQWYQALATRQVSGAPGLGLGLALSRELIEKMGGRISLTSQCGQGTTITLSLLRHA